MPVRTKKLAQGTSGAASTFVDAYTCASDETTILKSLVIVGVAAGTYRIQVSTLSGGLSVPIVDQPIGVDAVLRVDLWHVLAPGDKIRVWSVTASAFRYWFSGTELEGVAD